MSVCDVVIAAICNLCLVLVLDVVPSSSEPKLADSSPPARSALLTNMLCDYDTRIRPSLDVKIKFALFIERATVDEHCLLMETWSITEWKDDTLSWTPSDYDNIQEIDIPAAKIWNPPIATISTLPWSREQTSQELWMGSCEVTYNGTVSCLSAMEVGGDCQMDVRYWPHMRSACEVYFGLDFRVDDNVYLEIFLNDTKDGEVADYSPSQDWLITALRRHSVELPDSRGLVYLLFLHKQGDVLAGTIALLVVVLCSLILTTFFLPVGSESRFGLGCCAFFSLLLIAICSFETLPSVGGETTPIVVTVYRILLLLAGLALLEPLVLSMLIPTDKKPPPPPRWLYALRTWFFSSATGKTILTVLLLSPSNSEKTSEAVEMMLALHMQAGGSGGADGAASADTADTEGDASNDPVSSIAEANAGPHKIWNFFVSVLDRALFAFYAVACLALSVVTIYAMLPFDKSDLLEVAEWSFL